jgi:hypothetical protein
LQSPSREFRRELGLGHGLLSHEEVQAARDPAQAGFNGAFHETPTLVHEEPDLTMLGPGRQHDVELAIVREVIDDGPAGDIVNIAGCSRWSAWPWVSTRKARTRTWSWSHGSA